MRYQGETFGGSCRTALTPLTRTALTPLIRGAGGLIPFPLDKGGRGVTLTRGLGVSKTTKTAHAHLISGLP